MNLTQKQTPNTKKTTRMRIKKTKTRQRQNLTTTSANEFIQIGSLKKTSKASKARARINIVQSNDTYSVFLSDVPHKHIANDKLWGIPGEIKEKIIQDYPKGVTTCSGIRFNLFENHKIQLEDIPSNILFCFELYFE